VIVADLKLTEDGEKFMKGEGAKAAVFTKCDVAKRADLENLITVSEKEFGDIPDVYVAGAGVFEPSFSSFWDDTEDDGYASVDININHPLKLSRIAIRALLGKNKKGVILIAASVAGFAGAYAAPLYCTTKHAVVGFVRSMEALGELEGIKVCAVAPGLVQTPLWTDYPEKIKQFGYSVENSITPDEVAEGMIDLVTDGKYGSGTTLEITTSGTRVLGTWNIEPPTTAGGSIPRVSLEINVAPIAAKLKKERGANI